MRNNLDLNFKLNFKRILFSLIVGVLCTLTFSGSKAYAFSSVSEFLGAGHQPGSAQLIGDTFYFCQGDTTATYAISYRTIGFKVEVTFNGNTYSFSSPINYRQDGIPGLFNNSREYKDGKTWDLWSIGYHVIVNKLIEIYPGVDFSDLYNKNSSATFTFRGYVTQTTDYEQSWEGYLHPDGSTTGVVYCKEDWQPKPYYYMTNKGWADLKSVKRVGSGGDYQKPDTPDVDTTKVTVDSRNPAKTMLTWYDNMETLFTQPNENIVIKFTSRASFYDDKARIRSTFYQMTNSQNAHVGTLRMNIARGSDSTWAGKDDLNYDRGNPWNDQTFTSWDKYLGDYYHNEVWSHRPSGTEVESKYNLKMVEHAQFYNFYPAAQIKLMDTDSVIKQSGYFEHNKGLRIISDGVAPNYGGLSVTNTNGDSYKITATGVNDNNTVPVPGSGVMGVNVIVSNSTGELAWIDLPKVSEGTYSATVDLSKYNKEDVNLSLWMQDNVGNNARYDNLNTIYFGQKLTSTIEDYIYKDDLGIKWTKANSPFYIKQNGSYKSTAPDSLGAYFLENKQNVYGSKTSPNGLSLLVNKDSGLSKSTKTNSKGYEFTKGRKESNSKTYLVADTSKESAIYDLYHNLESSNLGFTGKVQYSGEILGIDNAKPKVEFDGSTNLVVKDDESGLKTVTVTGNFTNKKLTGKEQSITVNFGNKKTLEVTVTDNVGNSTTVTINKGAEIKPNNPNNPKDQWEGKSSAYIKATEVLMNDKRRLKVDVSVTVSATSRYEYAYTEERVDAYGNKYETEVYKWVDYPFRGSFTGSDGTTFDYYTTSTSGKTFTNSYYIDDIDNQSFGPQLTYETTSGDNRVVKVNKLADLMHTYTFNVSGSADGDNRVSDTLTVDWCSRYDHFKFNLYRLTDDEFNTLSSPVTIFKDRKVEPNNEILMSYLQTGRYRVEVTMYDFNKNPSVTSVLEFEHDQPHRYAQMEMNMTAIKDINWENEIYPIDYKSQEYKFPLGDAYRFNGHEIAKGYAANYNFAIPEGLSYSNLKAVYTIYGKDGYGNEIPLTGTSSGTSLSSLDSRNGTTFLKQTKDFIKKSDIIYMKHYLPSNTVFTDSSNRVYEGDVYVKVKVTADLRNNGDDYIDVGRISGLYKIYKYTQSRTAEDDLELNKQR